MQKVLVKVLVNGNQIENPIEGSIKRSLDNVSSCYLFYPSREGSTMLRFSGRDLFTVYVGVDKLPSTPTFRGYLSEVSSDGQFAKLFLSGRLGALEKRYIFINNYSNFDGLECGAAIKKIIESGLGITISSLGGTNPPIFIPSSFREEKGISMYKAIQRINEFAYYIDYENGEVLGYVLFEDGFGDFHFLKETPANLNYVSYTLIRGKNFTEARPNVSLFEVINKQKVILKNNRVVEFTLQNEMQTSFYGICEGEPIQLESEDEHEALLEAIRVCYLSREPFFSIEIESIDLLDAIPGISLVRLIGIPELTSELSRVNSVDISFSDGLEVKCNLEKPKPKLGVNLLKLLNTS